MKKVFSGLSEKGQVTLIVVLIILSASVVLVSALGLLTFNEIKKINNVVKSAQSYYVSESGIEDAVLRLKNKMKYGSNYNLAVGAGNAVVDISGPLTDVSIISEGNVQGRVRKIAVNMQATPSETDVSFNYGVQVGYGGLIMGNNSQIVGNVYSNGPIQGGAGSLSYVTGSAFSASGASASVDQVNDTPIPATDSIIFGNSSSAQDAAQSFQVSNSNTANKVDLHIRKQGNPGNLTVRVTTNNSGNPSSATLTQGTLNAGVVTNNFGWVTVSFDPIVQLNSGVTYWLVLDGGNNSNHYYTWAANSSYTAGQAKTGPYSSGPWNSTGKDGYFRFYVGGSVGSIDNMQIGAGGVGDAHANTITNTTVAGTLYCQTGSSDCDTSQPDPPPEDMPISEANIDQWRNEGGAGGTISGDYTPSGSSSFLGPKSITGNLIVPIDHILTITGTVWVEGSIEFRNGSQIKLDPAYDTDSGIMLADGYVKIFDGVIFSGSGQTGSYIMVLSTNDCDGTGSPTGQTCTDNSSAMIVSNNSQNVVLYAAEGQMRIRQNANTKEATAYKMYLEENVIVTYEAGLGNVNFISGPGAVFEIKSWQEIQ